MSRNRTRLLLAGVVAMLAHSSINAQTIEDRTGSFTQRTPFMVLNDVVEVTGLDLEVGLEPANSNCAGCPDPADNTACDSCQSCPVQCDQQCESESCTVGNCDSGRPCSCTSSPVCMVEMLATLACCDNELTSGKSVETSGTKVISGCTKSPCDQCQICAVNPNMNQLAGTCRGCEECESGMCEDSETTNPANWWTFGDTRPVQPMAEHKHFQMAKMVQSALRSSKCDSECINSIVCAMEIVERQTRTELKTELTLLQMKHEKEMARIRSELMQANAKLNVYGDTMTQVQHWVGPLYTNQNRNHRQLQQLANHHANVQRTLSRLEKKLEPAQAAQNPLPSYPANPYASTELPGEADHPQVELFHLRDRVKELERQLEGRKDAEVRPAKHLQPIYPDEKVLDPIYKTTYPNPYPYRPSERR